MRIAPTAIFALVAASLSGCARVRTQSAPPPPDAAVLDLAIDAGLVDHAIDVVGLPHIDDFSGASQDHVLALVRAAIDGLGFDPTTAQGPNSDDRMFVGQHYLAWIDQTGFYGKLNGIWSLNGVAGDGLDFIVKDPDGRPVNFLVPGEDGEGRWAPGYRGGEHIEFPSNIPEADDPSSCASGAWCNQFGLNEAAPITNPNVPWWSACNPGSPGFDQKFAPIIEEPIPNGIKLVYEGRLVKEADGADSNGNYDASNCHGDYLFSDGVRRPVYLRVGYELHADVDYVDRTMQLRNPLGNPPLQGNKSLIGGFVVTGWPNPYYLKRVNRFWRPENANVPLSWGGNNVTLNASTWNDLSTQTPSPQDVLVSWIDQPITLSPAPTYSAGRSATLAHVGASDNKDVGVCLCAVHGGIEMGGGLIHAGISLPIDPGQMTIEAKRRLTLPSDGPLAKPLSHTYDAIHDLSHLIGRVDGDGWSASTGSDSASYLVYGPYATDWGNAAAQVVIYLLVDNNSANNDVVATLDINDATISQVVASRPIHRGELRAPLQYQRFSLNVDLANRGGHKMESRLYWNKTSYVRVKNVIVNLVNPVDE
jgi:hypothetical protein